MELTMVEPKYKVGDKVIIECVLSEYTAEQLNNEDVSFWTDGDHWKIISHAPVLNFNNGE